MADEENEDPTEERSDDNPTAKKLRKLLKEQGQENKDLKSRVSNLSLDNTIHGAGLSDLKPRQLSALKRELEQEGEDLTADKVKEVAGELGYSTPSNPTQPDSSQSNPPDANAQPDPNAQPPAQPDPSQLDPRLQQSAAAMMGQTGATNAPGMQESFEQALANAQTREEKIRVIKERGGQAGLVHEHDLQ